MATLPDCPPGRVKKIGPPASPPEGRTNNTRKIPAARQVSAVHQSTVRADIRAGAVAEPERRRRDAASRLPLLPCGLCSDPLPCDLARWCPAWDGRRPDARRGLDEALDHLHTSGLDVCELITGRCRHQDGEGAA